MLRNNINTKRCEPVLFIQHIKIIFVLVIVRYKKKFVPYNTYIMLEIIFYVLMIWGDDNIPRFIIFRPAACKYIIPQD